MKGHVTRHNSRVGTHPRRSMTRLYEFVLPGRRAGPQRGDAAQAAGNSWCPRALTRLVSSKNVLRGR